MDTTGCNCGTNRKISMKTIVKCWSFTYTNDDFDEVQWNCDNPCKNEGVCQSADVPSKYSVHTVFPQVEVALEY